MLVIDILYHVSSWVIIFIVLSFVAANLYPVLFRVTKNINLDYSAFYILIYGLLAPFAASVAVIVLSLPDFAFSFVEDHCHGIECSPHGLQVNLSSVYGIAKVSFLVGLLVISGAAIALQLLSNRHKMNLLDRLAEPTSSSYKIVDSTCDLAWCSGLLRPKIFISRGLAEKLSEAEMQVVLSHENMHATRKDNLRKWLLHWSTVTWPKKFRVKIRTDLTNFTEQICDLAAVSAHDNQQSLHVALDTLNKCNIDSISNDRAGLVDNPAVRAQKLRQACTATQCSDNKPSLFANWAPSVYVISLLFATVVVTVRIGHPILEWVAL